MTVEKSTRFVWTFSNFVSSQEINVLDRPLRTTLYIVKVGFSGAFTISVVYRCLAFFECSFVSNLIYFNILKEKCSNYSPFYNSDIAGIPLNRSLYFT